MGVLYTPDVLHANSRELFEDYYRSRLLLDDPEQSIGDEELTKIQTETYDWLRLEFPDIDKTSDVTDYQSYDRGIVESKICGLTRFLRQNYPNINQQELDATDKFVNSTFAMWESRNDINNKYKDGSFAFVVPARMSRENPEYGAEVEPVIPALRYVPNELRAWMMRECPPFIIDTYLPDENGKRGYLVYAPISGDMINDLGKESLSTFLKTARSRVNDAVDFAKDQLGVRVVGLGATLPRITNHGKTIGREDVITTTGHGGTVRLICETIDKLGGEDSKKKSIGILGLGAIGAAAAHVAADMYPGQINVFDSNKSTMSKCVKQLEIDYPERVVASETNTEFINESDVIISAVTSPVHIEEAGITDMSDKLVIDDSQPAMFDPNEVERLGGKLVWVIGSDNTGRVRRFGYDYGTMYDSRTDLFGCEAEAAVLERHWSELEKNGKSPTEAKDIIGRLALDGPVDPTKAKRITKLFEEYGISIARPQAFGKPVEI